MKELLKVVITLCAIVGTVAGVIFGIGAYMERGEYMNGANVMNLGRMHLDVFPFTVYLLQSTKPFTFITNTHILEIVESEKEAKLECINHTVRYPSTVCHLYKLNLVGQTLEELPIDITNCPDLLSSP